jgi:hypothetical protein
VLELTLLLVEYATMASWASFDLLIEVSLARRRTLLVLQIMT